MLQKINALKRKMNALYKYKEAEYITWKVQLKG